MEFVTIRELKQEVGQVTRAFRFHAQLDRLASRTTKTGNPFYELTFADAEETLVLRVWNNAPMFATCGQLRSGQFFEVSGEFGLGGDNRSIDGKSWTARPLNEDETALVLGGTPELRAKQENDYAFIESAVAGIADPRLRALCLAFLERYGKRLRRTAGARDYHHARRGGLVEHVAQMMRTATQICVVYPLLNRDLLVAGILFHDVGKLWENAFLESGFSMPYTEVSELLSHIPLGVEVVNKLWRELLDQEEGAASWGDLEPDTERVRLHLIHLIISHHGELEFGSPAVPKTPEAQALHYIDNLDAKMEMFERGYQVAAELGKNVYERVRPLPGRLVTPLPAYTAKEIVEPEDGPGTLPEVPDTEGADEPF